MNKNSLRKIYGAIAMLLTAAIMAAVFAIMGIWPFGEKSILIYDLRSQYADFFAALRSFVSEGGFFYSLSRAFGGDTFTLTAYYLLSPFNLLFFVFPREAIIETATLIYFLKIMCVSAAFYLFITRTAVFSLRPEAAVLLSLCYCFSGFAVMYAQNLMWLDALYMLPLALLAAERAVFTGKIGGLTASVAAIFVINFYTALPIAVFIGLYCVFLLFNSEKPLPLVSIPRVTAAIGTGFLLSSPITFTAFCKLAETKLSDGNILLRIFTRDKLTFVLLCGWIFAAIVTFAAIITAKRLGKSAENDKNSEKVIHPSDRAVVIAVIATAVIFAVSAITNPGAFTADIKKLLPFVYDRDTPPLYSSSLCVILASIPIIRAILYRQPRELCFTALIIAALLPTICRPLDILLHMGQNPISFPARYSYIITFAFVFSAAYALSTLKRELLNSRVIAAIALSAAAITVGELGIAYVGGYKYNENVYYGYYEKSSFDIYRAETSDALENIGGGRTEKTFYRYLNDSLALGYNGLTHYSSMYNRPLISLMHTLGYASSEYWSSYFGSTPVLDSLFDVGNVMSFTGDEFSDRAYIKRSGGEYARILYDETYKNSFIKLYKNDGALGLGYVVSEGFDALTLDTLTPFEAQNELVSAMLGSRAALFTPVDYGEPMSFGMETLDVGYRKSGEDSHLSYMFIAPDDGTIYMYLDSSDPLPCEIKVNGGTISNYRSSQSGIAYTLCLGDFKRGESVNVALTPKSDEMTIEKLYIYTLSNDYSSVINSIPRGETKSAQSETKFTFQTSEGGTLFTSLPYESGWSVKVDGKNADFYAGAGAFICVRLGEGAHTVKMTYTPPGLYLGFMLCIAGIVAVFAENIDIKAKKNAQFIISHK